MPKIRGVIALLIAVTLGLFSAWTVSQYLKSSHKKKAVQKKAVPEEKKVPPKPPAFTDTIPTGMRAISIKVDEVSGVSRELQKNDLVDVIATTKLNSKDGAKVSRVILEAVEVLDIRLDQSDKESMGKKNTRYWTVALAVTPEEAAAFAAASQGAHIYLMARNKNDTLSQEKVIEVAYTSKEGTRNLVREEKDDLLKHIPPQMRAMTVEVRDVDGICGQLKQGDRVDLIVTCPISKFSSSGDVSSGAKGTVTSYQIGSRVVLQDLAILATEKNLGKDIDPESPVKKVTLLVTLSEAEKLAALTDGTDKSIIRLVSRGKDDRAMLQTNGQNLSDILT